MRADLEDRLRFCRSLPTLPSVALRVIELGGDPDVGIGELAKVIALDPALAAKFLKAANSPLYGVRRKTDNLRQALSLLGLHTAITLALSFSLAASPARAGRAGLDTKLYWRRSLLAAMASRALGEHRGVTSLEELFLAGLLQDIGMLVLDSMMPTEYGPLVAAARDHEQLARAERKALGVDHAEVGAWLLRHWRLPEYLQLAVAGSNDPADAKAPEDIVFIVPCVALSGRIADVWLHPDNRRLSARAARAAERWLGLSKDDYRAVFDAMAGALPEVSALFEIELVDPLQISGILDQAQELVTLRSLQDSDEARHRIDGLESRTLSLAEQARLDPLTGLFNRARLDEFLVREFNDATERGWPLSLAFLDLDRFKEVNDTYGHQVGDRVLVSIGRLLAGNVRQTDLAARYGGEEFVIILPGTGGAAARMVLERILSVLRAQDHASSGGAPIRVTTSIGLATHMEGNQRFERPEELLKAADQALYAAKRAGRDRVAAYTERVDPAGG